MTRLALALFLAPHLFGAYSYYQVDNFTSLSSNWSVNGTPTVGNNLFTAGTGASLISNIATQTDNYEVKATLRSVNNGGGYAIYLRATANAHFNTTSTGEFYVVELTSPWITEEGHRIAGLTVTKRVGTTTTQLWGAWQFVHDYTELRVICSNNLITLYVDGIFRGVIADSSLASGRPGIGVRGTGSPNGWASVSIGALDTAAPSAISSGAVQSTAYPNQVRLRWTVPADDTNGIGVNNFNLFRIQGGVTTWLDYRRLYAGESALTYSGPVNQMEFVDEAVTPGQSYTYKLIPVDWHWNAGPDTLVNVTVPASSSLDARQVGVHSSSAHWGSGGEQIDMRSGNLNFTLPLVTAQGRGGSSINIALNYNSQQWRLDNNVVWKLGTDVGYGFGWRLLVGSITPYWTEPSVLHHWIYTDGSGAEHRFDLKQGTNQWLSKTSYATFDDSNMRLRFNDGSYLDFLSLSDSSEPDAGARYPTLFQDSNGNQIKIAYMRGRASAWSNASARLWRVEDVRATGYGSYPYTTYRTYSFNYTTNELLPHLTGIANHIGSGDSYTLVYSPAAALTDPFSTSGSFGQTRNLTELRHSTLNLAHTFTYGYGSELTAATNPHGGTLSWTHTTHIFANSRGIREVGSRTGPAGTHQFVRDVSDSGRPFHPYTKLMDPDGQTDRYYRFDNTSTNPHYGYISQIDHTERASGTVRLREAFTWAQDILTPQPRSYVGTATTTYDPGTGTSAAKSVTQVVDIYGRLTSRTENDYTTSGYTPQSPRVTQYTYLTGTDYESRFIRDRIRTVIVSQGAQSYTLVDNTYDNYSGANSLVNRTDLRQHNTSSYGAGFTFRGNPTATTRLGSATITRRFDITGMATEIKEGTSTVTVEPTANNAVPGLITPNSQSSLSTSLYWNSFLGLTQTTGPNGATATSAFDSYARKSQTTSPHGAPTAYSYTYQPNTVTAVTTTTAPGGTRKRFARTTFDGFGRTIKEESGSGDPAATHQVLSVVDTEYGPCACSPLGKLKRVSRPRAPGGAVHWTTYSYDVLGRTLSVTLPASAGSTSYSYSANNVTVTDPAGKWKTHQQDGFGNLVKVLEPGSLTTTYEYNVLGKLTKVKMPRNGPSGWYEQQRTFTYNSLGQLYQTTQPETGTKTFVYNSDGTIQYKTDAKNQKIVYFYDSYKRVTKVERHKGNLGYPVLDPDQTTEYFYDSFDPTFTQYGWGRLNAVRYRIKTDVSPSPSRVMPVTELYSYTMGGAVTRKRLSVTYSTGNGTTSDLDLFYTHDNEGRVVATTYPATHDDSGNQVNGRAYTYGYDAASRLSSINEDTTTTVLQSVGYNAAGQVTAMMYGANNRWMNESRGYNDLGQLTSISGGIMGSTVSNTYAYQPTTNNGRISSMTTAYPPNLGPSETVAYTYDDLNRLTKAEVTGAGAWKQDFYHDGWGNFNGYWGTGAPSYSPGPADPVTNRAPGATYDNNGNQLPPNKPLCYDVENRPTCSEPYDYAIGYAPDNKRIWEGAAYNDPGTGHDFSEDRFTLYGLDGQRVGIYRIRNRMTPPDTINMRFVTMEENVWVGKKLLKTRKGTTTEVVLQDRLGSVLFRYNANTDAKKAYAYYPYGQSRGINTPDNEEGFGTYTRLDNNENHYADQRYYNAKNGRFHQPDPYQASGGPTDPASWNRYTYVHGDPVNFYDPRGLFACSVGYYYNPETEQCYPYWVPNFPDPALPLPKDPEPPASPEPLWGAATVSAWEDMAYDMLAKKKCYESLGFRSTEGARTALLTTPRHEDELDESVAVPLANGGHDIRWVVARARSGAIFVNSRGPFGNPAEHQFRIVGTQEYRTVNLLTVHEDILGLASGTLSPDQFRALYLLHELGHIKGVFEDERDDFQKSIAISKSVWNNCFK